MGILTAGSWWEVLYFMLRWRSEEYTQRNTTHAERERKKEKIYRGKRINFLEYLVSFEGASFYSPNLPFCVVNCGSSLFLSLSLSVSLSLSLSLSPSLSLFVSVSLSLSVSLSNRTYINAIVADILE